VTEGGTERPASEGGPYKGEDRKKRRRGRAEARPYYGKDGRKKEGRAKARPYK